MKKSIVTIILSTLLFCFGVAKVFAKSSMQCKVVQAVNYSEDTKQLNTFEPEGSFEVDLVFITGKNAVVFGNEMFEPSQGNKINSLTKIEKPIKMFTDIARYIELKNYDKQTKTLTLLENSYYFNSMAIYKCK